MEPVPTQAWYDRLYGEEFWEAKSHKQPNGDTWSNQQQWHKGLARAEKYIDLLRGLEKARTIRSVLEVGASFGVIGTAIAREFGATAYGVEPNHAAREFASRVSGMKMVAETAGALQAWTPETPVDLVIFSHALENILDLDTTLATVHSKVEPGALLLIETPNVNWQPSMSIYHPYCFTAQALSLLLARKGFRVIQATYSGRPASAVIPRYLTVIAEAVPDDKQTQSDTTVTRRSARGVKIRQSLYKSYYSTPLGGLDASICSKKFNRAPFVLQGVQRIRERLDQLGRG